ncbi:MAG: hypothetical protein DRO93_08190 [Candidatus Thorarchaeota archaeon]|nr:MAG: hypothetical protein DRO93_08190 [Candidatus Thorarchaeota archaeon]
MTMNIFTDSSWWIVGIVVAIMYIWSLRKNREKTVHAFRRSGRFILKSLPLFFLAVLLIGFMQIVLADFIEYSFQDPNVGILSATVLGLLLPGPRYAIYPLAQVILVAGGNIGAVMALIASQQLLDVPEGCFIEVKFLGGRFFLARLLIAVATTLVAGYLAYAVNFFIPLWSP